MQSEKFTEIFSLLAEGNKLTAAGKTTEAQAYFGQAEYGLGQILKTDKTLEKEDKLAIYHGLAEAGLGAHNGGLQKAKTWLFEALKLEGGEKVKLLNSETTDFFDEKIQETQGYEIVYDIKAASPETSALFARYLLKKNSMMLPENAGESDTLHKILTPGVLKLAQAFAKASGPEKSPELLAAIELAQHEENEKCLKILRRKVPEKCHEATPGTEKFREWEGNLKILEGLRKTPTIKLDIIRPQYSLAEVAQYL